MHRASILKTLAHRALPALLALGVASAACAAPAAAPVGLRFPSTGHPFAKPRPGGPRLHGLTTYWGLHVPVFVRASKTPQLLHLTSWEGAIWHIYLFPGANLRRVYLSGREPQRLVLHRSRLDRGRASPQIVDLGQNLRDHPTLGDGIPRWPQSRRQPAYQAELRRRTGHDLTDFQGRDIVRQGEAFAVPAAGRPKLTEVRAHFPDAVLRDARPALDDYRRVRRDLAALVARGALPARLPIWGGELRLAEGWPLLPDGPPGTTRFHDRTCAVIELGTAADEVFWCGGSDLWAAYSLWQIGGAGRDIFDDHNDLSQVTSGGSGDDLILTDRGNDVLHFGAGWGDDVVETNCHGRDAEVYRGTQRGDPPHWYNRYIVFGRGIRPRDLFWVSPRELVHRPSGSRIRFGEEGVCAYFRAVEAGEVPLPPVAERE